MIDGVFVELMPDTGWRIMLGLAAIPGLVMYYGFLNLPESPRWLAMKGQSELALAVLKSLRESDQDAIDELAKIEQSVVSHRHERAADSGTVLAEVDDDDIDDIDDDIDDIDDDDEQDQAALEYGAVPQPTVAARRLQDDEVGLIPRFVHMVSHAPTRRALILGCGLMVVQQCSGINTYVPSR